MPLSRVVLASCSAAAAALGLGLVAFIRLRASAQSSDAPQTEQAATEPPRPEDSRIPFGVRIKPGVQSVSEAEWALILDFIESGEWCRPDPATAEDAAEGPARTLPPNGAGGLMMGFDFFMTADGPRLIEVNTNAGGFCSVIHLAASNFEKIVLESRFVEAIRAEYLAVRGAGQGSGPKHVAIIDENVTQMQLYPEMLEMARLLTAAGIT